MFPNPMNAICIFHSSYCVLARLGEEARRVSVAGNSSGVGAPLGYSIHTSLKASQLFIQKCPPIVCHSQQPDRTGDAKADRNRLGREGALVTHVLLSSKRA
jgi:hypothetical protein